MADGKNTDFCTVCRRETEYMLREDTVQKLIRGKEYSFKVYHAFCSECGEEMDIPGLADYNMQSIDRQYRQMENLVSIDDIKKLMEIYHLGKAPLSCALGFGEITITRYLYGQIPSREYSDIIRRALTSPRYMNEQLEKNADKLGITAYRKAKKAARELTDAFGVSDKMLVAISYLFAQMQEVTPLALQKLLYFVQGIYLVLVGTPFFEEDCQAWVHGPVYENVYNLFKNFKYNPIEDDRFAVFRERFAELDQTEKKVIDLVIDSFGLYSGKTLERITHREQPWLEARGNTEPFSLSREIITKAAIKTYFEEVAGRYGVDSADGLNAYIRAQLSSSSS